MKSRKTMFTGTLSLQAALIGFLSFFAVVALTASPALAAGKIGVIDFQRVLKESRGGKAAKAQIENRGKKMEAELKAKGEELEKLKKKLEAEALVMNEDARKEKERDFRIRVNDFKSMQQNYARDFKRFEADVIKKVQKTVFKLVEGIGNKDGYTLILERAMTLYHDDAVDLTDKLIKSYDAVK